MTEPTTTRAEERIGGYRVVRTLATGGTADVLLAKADWPLGLQRTVVLKRLPTEHARDERLAKKFTREASAYARLADPTIVQLLDFVALDGQLVMVLEHVDGAPLDRTRRMLAAIAHVVDDAAAVYICGRVYAALAIAHAAKDESGVPAPMIHRDVNPSNILLGWDGAVKLTDFGAVKLEGPKEESFACLLEAQCGYMAPEQIAGEPLSASSDVYAAGVILWELLAKRRAFPRGMSAAALAEMQRPRLPSLDDLRPDLDERLRDVVRRALEPRADARDITAASIAATLGAVVPAAEGLEQLRALLATVRHEPEPLPSAPPPAQGDVLAAIPSSLPAAIFSGAADSAGAVEIPKPPSVPRFAAVRVARPVLRKTGKPVSMPKMAAVKPASVPKMPAAAPKPPPPPKRSAGNPSAPKLPARANDVEPDLNVTAVVPAIDAIAAALEAEALRERTETLPTTVRPTPMTTEPLVARPKPRDPSSFPAHEKALVLELARSREPEAHEPHAEPPIAPAPPVAAVEPPPAVTFAPIVFIGTSATDLAPPELSAPEAPPRAPDAMPALANALPPDSDPQAPKGEDAGVRTGRLPIEDAPSIPAEPPSAERVWSRGAVERDAEADPFATDERQSFDSEIDATVLPRPRRPTRWGLRSVSLLLAMGIAFAVLHQHRMLQGVDEEVDEAWHRASIALGRSASTPDTTPLSAIAPAAIVAPSASAEAAPGTAPAIPADMTLLETEGAVPGRRVFVDDRTIGETPNATLVKCGPHVVRLGSAGRGHTIDLPCGRELAIGDR